MKQVNSVDDATSQKIISFFLKYPANVMLFNTASTQVSVIKMKARYEVKNLLNILCKQNGRTLLAQWFILMYLGK